ncbi:MAG: DUF3303 family protein [Chloroflexota bacterium]
MLFQVVHSHTIETCPAQSSEAAKRLGTWWQALKKTPGVKIVVGNVSPLDHTFYITVEADDYPTLAKALGPLVSIGTGHVIPVITLDQAFPMAETGAFRASK